VSVTPRLGIYFGEGTAHSWIWWAETFERFGWYRQRFLDEESFLADLRDIDVLCLSGGDTHEIARGLGQRGARELTRFLESGKWYLGSCAGAYLPLHSSQEPLCWFNLLPVKTHNIVSKPPAGLEFSPRTMIRYGERFLIHPARGETVLKLHVPFSEAEVVAPLFGGPPMVCNGSAPGYERLAFYQDFTPRTDFPAGADLAREIVLGREAIIRAPVGGGMMLLFGPHLEHPRYASANRLMFQLIAPAFDYYSGEARTAETGETLPLSLPLLRETKAELSRSRFEIQRLMSLSLSWEIGRKMYDPGKIAELVEFAWKRIRRMERFGGIPVGPGEGIRERAFDLRSAMYSLRDAVPNGESSREMLDALRAAKQFLAGFLPVYHQECGSGGDAC